MLGLVVETADLGGQPAKQLSALLCFVLTPTADASLHRALTAYIVDRREGPDAGIDCCDMTALGLGGFRIVVLGDRDADAHEVALRETLILDSHIAVEDKRQCIGLLSAHHRAVSGGPEDGRKDALLGLAIQHEALDVDAPGAVLLGAELEVAFEGPLLGFQSTTRLVHVHDVCVANLGGNTPEALWGLLLPWVCGTWQFLAVLDLTVLLAG